MSLRERQEVGRISPESVVQLNSNRRVMPTREQEQMLFRGLRGEPVQTITHPQFMRDVNPEDRQKWFYILATNTSMEGVIATINQRLVVHMAKKINERGLSASEKIRGGNEGLIKAIPKFDPERGFRFTTYAKWDILNGMFQVAREKLGLTKTEYEDLRKARYVAGVYFEIFGRFPNTDELRKQLLSNTEITLNHINTVLTVIGSAADVPKSFSEPVGHEGGATLGDMIADTSVNVEEEAIEATALVEVRTAVSRALKFLSEEERDIIQRVFNIGNHGVTQPESERILPGENEILIRALAKLKQDPNIQRLREQDNDTQASNHLDQSTAEIPIIPDKPDDPRQVSLEDRLDAAEGRIERIAILKSERFSSEQIATRLQLKLSTVYEYASMARRSGKLKDLPSRRKLSLAAKSETTELVREAMEKDKKRFTVWLNHEILPSKSLAKSSKDLVEAGKTVFASNESP